ncbi:hypothetical protein Pmani_015020 [Petrolisthes manimaculis]|uniref:Reverse transcriptase domain-containing protein n=1 Tax=Petrolisthes manimaculis TaxID=1843537 RepID=A0AAE1PSG3_9EUCA|nr:hypothetical protein Pmani_015020 [Petrolisthes manimaculis]
MFADDTKIYRNISNTDDQKRLQVNLTQIQQWSNTWLISFHPDKCKLMELGTTRLHDEQRTGNSHPDQNVTTVTTSKKVRDMTNKALMMVDGEAGATQHTNQLSDVTLPLMDKVNILLDDNKSEELEEVKPDNRENQNDNIYFKVTKDGGGLFFHCLQNQNLLPDAFTMPVSS